MARTLNDTTRTQPTNMDCHPYLCQAKGEILPMPSRIDRFGLMISLELTRNISPMYRWFVGTKTLHNSSSSLSLCRKTNKKTKDQQPIDASNTNTMHLTWFSRSSRKAHPKVIVMLEIQGKRILEWCWTAFVWFQLIKMRRQKTEEN